MQTIPVRSSLVAQTATILRENILTGVWSDLVPGELELCERFQISRVTLRAALEQLRIEGWFRTAQGKRREITRDRALKSTVNLGECVVLLSPQPLQELTATALFKMVTLRDSLEAAGYRVEVEANHACYSSHPNHALEAVTRKYRPSGYVVHLSTAPMQQWFSDHRLSCVISGSRHPNVELPSVAIDYEAVCRHAVNLLTGVGRNRLALLMPHSNQAGNLESEHGFMEAGLKCRTQGVKTSVAHHDGTSNAICNLLDGLLQRSEPVVGFLVAKPSHVVTAITHLLRRGIRIPQDVSLISRDDDPLLEDLVPTVTRYHADSARFARKISRVIIRLMREGVGRRCDTRLMPSLVRGETLGQTNPRL